MLGATDTGLTGTELGTILGRCGVPDINPTATKRYRLRDALLSRQQQDGAANCIIKFITTAMEPVRYRESPSLFTLRQDALDEVLVFIGLRVNDKGKIQRGTKADTLPEAARHANSLRAELRRRDVHAEVLRYASREVLERNAFHAVLEASKSVPDRLRRMAGLQGDGAALIDATLTLGASGTPRIRINTLATASERDEQTGFATLIKGLLGMFRNPVAHDPRMSRTVTDEELLELLMIVSMVHRRLDGATVDS